jgi:hypothetical protein
MIPRMMFSIKVELEFFAADRVKHERRKKQDRRANVNNINHRFRFLECEGAGLCLNYNSSKQTVNDSQSNLFMK